MKKLIVYNWIILSISSLLVGIYISVFESFLHDKAYLYFMMAIGFGFVYYKKRKEVL